MQYFWLCKKHEEDKKKNPDDTSLQLSCDMHSEMREIDDMWHTFLLFTKDYADFCEKYFGEFIHHFPNTAKGKFNPKHFETEFTRYLSYTYNNLGGKTVKTWFSELL